MERTVRALTRHYPNRDQVVTQALAVLEQYPGVLNPEQADFTYDDGRVELLLSLQGVVPVPIGQNTYHCPIAFWLPLDFPAKPPVVLIVPSETLAVRKSKHVDPSGRVEIGYLEQWARKAEGCSLTSLINDLIPVFSARYPVQTIQAKPKAAPPPPPAPPALPSSSSATASPTPAAAQPPPPRPPLPPQATGSPAPGASSSAAAGAAYPPPRPPLPPQVGSTASGAGGRPGSMVFSDGGGARAASPAVGGAGVGGMPPRPPLPPGVGSGASVGGGPGGPPMPPPLPGSFQHAHRSSTLGFPPPHPPQAPQVPAAPSPFAGPPPLGPPQPPPPQFSPQPPQPPPAMSPPQPPPPAFGGPPPHPPTMGFQPSPQASLQPPHPPYHAAVASPQPPQPPSPAQQPPAPLPLPGSIDTVASPPPPPPQQPAQQRPPSPSQSTVRSFSPAPSSAGTAQHVAPPPAPAPAGPPPPPSHGPPEGAQREASTRRVHHQPEPEPIERAYSPAPSEAFSVASSSYPYHQQAQQQQQQPPPQPRYAREQGQGQGPGHRHASSARGSYDPHQQQHQQRSPPSARPQPRHPPPLQHEHDHHPYEPSEAGSYAPPVPVVGGARRPPPPPSESGYSLASGTAAGDYGSYLPPTMGTPSAASAASAASVAEGEVEAETPVEQQPPQALGVFRQEMRDRAVPQRKGTTAYYRVQEQAGRGWGPNGDEEEEDPAFEPVAETRRGGAPGSSPQQLQHQHQQQRYPPPLQGRQDSLDSAYTAGSYATGPSYGAQMQMQSPPVPPQMPPSRLNGHGGYAPAPQQPYGHEYAHAHAHGYGSYAGSSHPSSPPQQSFHLPAQPQPPYLPSPPPAPAPVPAAHQPRAARRPKPPRAATAHHVAALNILDAADEDLSSPTTASTPSSPSVASLPAVSAAGGAPGAPPPVPPNPSLLALRTRVHSKLSQALSSLHGSTSAHLQQLDLMRLDLEKSQPAIEDEMARLEAVRSVCAGVRERMERVVGEGERRMGEYEERGEGVEVDEIVCGSTVVYVQLLDLVAEDAALEDTLYALSRGLNSGGDANIDLERFLRTTRRLAKEQFVLRATINKILLGLAIRRERASSARQVEGGGGGAGSGRGTPAVEV
ncbi:hypothetical protein JCM6882_006649 [Rhodosporidiobolus microsporus]